MKRKSPRQMTNAQRRSLERAFREVREATQRSEEPLLNPSRRRLSEARSLEDTKREEAAWNFKPKGPPGTGRT